MKRVALLVVLTSCFTLAFAKKIRITVTDFQFTAKTVNAKVGDTIMWVWKMGTHTTTSTTIPAGALAWNKPIDATHKSFRYILKKAGTYNYRCNFTSRLGWLEK